MSRRKRDEVVMETDADLEAAAEDARRRTGANAYVVPDRVAIAEPDEVEGDAPSVTVSPAPSPVPHFHMTMDGHFWYQSAAAQLLDGLPTDRPTDYVEVGVFKGQSLAWLAVEVLNRQLPVTLHAVDTFAGWPGVLQGAALRAEFDKNIAEVKEALGDRLQIHAMSSVDAARQFPSRSLDVVWLDADHSYEAVKADIAAWLPRIRVGGVLGGDDWEMGGVAKAVSEAFPGKFTLGQGSRLGKPWAWWMVRV